MTKFHWHAGLAHFNGAWHSVYRLNTWPQDFKEKWQDVRTGSSSLNFFRAVFKEVATTILQPPPSENISPRKQKEATTSSLSGLTFTLQSAVNWAVFLHLLSFVNPWLWLNLAVLAACRCSYAWEIIVTFCGYYLSVCMLAQTS